MLTLSRRLGQAIVINDNILLVVTDIYRGGVRLQFSAPSDVRIMREELYLRIQQEHEEVRKIAGDS